MHGSRWRREETWPVGTAARRWRLPPTLHLARAAADRAARLDQRSRWCLGDAAGAQPPDGARRPATAVPPPDPRSRPQVQPQLRRGLPQRSDRGHQDAGAGAERERLRRALGTEAPQRLSRPLPNPERPPPRPSAPRLPRALQRASAAPLARPAPASRQPAARSSASQSQRRSLPARSPRRLDPRVRTRRMTPRMTTTEFLHPTGADRRARLPRRLPRKAETSSPHHRRSDCSISDRRASLVPGRPDPYGSGGDAAYVDARWRLCSPSADQKVLAAIAGARLSLARGRQEIGRPRVQGSPSAESTTIRLFFRTTDAPSYAEHSTGTHRNRISPAVVGRVSLWG